MPTAEEENKRRPTQSTSGRKPDTADGDMQHEDEESDLPYGLQVAKSYCADCATMHKEYSGALKRMDHPQMRKCMMKCLDGLGDHMDAVREKAEKHYPDHGKWRDSESPPKFGKKDMDEPEEEETDDSDDSDEMEASDEEKSLIARAQKALEEQTAELNRLTERIKLEKGI